MSVHYAVSSVVYVVLFHLIRYRRKIVRENLIRVFPHKTNGELRRIEKRFYRHFCNIFAEAYKALTISQEELISRLSIVNPEEVNQYIDSGRSVLVYAAHFGNWEWLIAVPYYMRGKMQAIYQPQNNRFANEVALMVRSRAGIEPIESQKSYRHMVRCMQKGLTTLTLIVGDQSPHSGAKKCWIDFFGFDTAFLMGPIAMAKRAKQTLVYPSFSEKKRGYYEVTFKTIATAEEVESLSTSALIERFAALLEDDIRREPWLWLWTHRRWKHKHKDFKDE